MTDRVEEAERRRRPIRAVATAVGALTEGQRWTTGLALVVLVAFLGFGMRQEGVRYVTAAGPATTLATSPMTPAAARPGDGFDPPSVATASEPTGLPTATSEPPVAATVVPSPPPAASGFADVLTVLAELLSTLLGIVGLAALGGLIG